jgi:hypothetical protein
MEDPTVAQAWLVAIPSAITAVSTWYINRKTKRTIGKTEEHLSAKSDGHHGEIESLKERIDALERTIGKVRDCQLVIAQKYTKSMNSLQKDLQLARRALEKSTIAPSSQTPAVAGEPKATDRPTETPSAPSPELDEKQGGIKIVDVPQQPIGKVKWEKE